MSSMSSMVEVRLYGRLRRFAQDPRVTADSIAWVPLEEQATVEEVLRRLGIDPTRRAQTLTLEEWARLYAEVGGRLP